MMFSLWCILNWKLLKVFLCKPLIVCRQLLNIVKDGVNITPIHIFQVFEWLFSRKVVSLKKSYFQFPVLYFLLLISFINQPQEHPGSLSHLQLPPLSQHLQQPLGSHPAPQQQPCSTPHWTPVHARARSDGHAQQDSLLHLCRTAHWTAGGHIRAEKWPTHPAKQTRQAPPGQSLQNRLPMGRSSPQARSPRTLRSPAPSAQRLQGGPGPSATTGALSKASVPSSSNIFIVYKYIYKYIHS